MSQSTKVPNALLTRYLTQLASNPIRTKAITAAILYFIQEVLSNHLAGLPARRLPRDAPTPFHALARLRVDLRSLKMATYGFAIAGPLGHLLTGTQQKIFAGRTSAGAKIAQLLTANLVIAPIQAAVYLSSMAVINGAKSVEEIMKSVKAGFLVFLRMAWAVSNVSMTVAQTLIPVHLWPVFFNGVQLLLGTYFTTQVKKQKMLAARRAAKETADKAGKPFETV